MNPTGRFLKNKNNMLNMRFHKDWKKRIILSISTTFLFVVYLLNILATDIFPVSVYKDEIPRSILTLLIILLPFSIFLGIYLSLKKIKKEYIIINATVFSVIISILGLIIAYYPSMKISTSIYAQFMYMLMAPFVIIIVVFIGTLIGFIIKDSKKILSMKKTLSAVILGAIILLIIDFILMFIYTY